MFKRIIGILVGVFMIAGLLQALNPSTGPAELIGSLAGTSALGYGAYTYAASKKALHNIRK